MTKTSLIQFRPITEPFSGFLGQARRAVIFWARFTGAVVLLGLIFGPFAPLAIVAFLLTLGLPVLLLILWGQSLDTELNWTEMDEGPW